MGKPDSLIGYVRGVFRKIIFMNHRLETATWKLIGKWVNCDYISTKDYYSEKKMDCFEQKNGWFSVTFGWQKLDTGNRLVYDLITKYFKNRLPQNSL